MSNEYLISFDSVSLEYKRRGVFSFGQKFIAIDNLSLSIKEGDTLAILGRNGAGKTSLVRLMAGIYEPSKGGITRKVEPLLLSIGAGLLGELSGLDNTLLKASYLGIKRESKDELLKKVLDYSELEEFFYRPVREYSSGMRARLAFSIAVQARPEMLIVDEALAAGDLYFRQKAIETLKGMMGACRAVVVIAHQKKFLQSSCERGIILEHGKKTFDGELSQALDVYHKDVKEG